MTWVQKFSSSIFRENRNVSLEKSKIFRQLWRIFYSGAKTSIAGTSLASAPKYFSTFKHIIFSGIFTGSVYKDYGLLKNGFPAESVVNGSVLVVKTHEWGPKARGAFSKAILLVRAPGPAIQAEFNRQSGGHVGFAGVDRYKRTKGKCKHDKTIP